MLLMYLLLREKLLLDDAHSGGDLSCLFVSTAGEERQNLDAMNRLHATNRVDVQATRHFGCALSSVSWV